MRRGLGTKQKYRLMPDAFGDGENAVGETTNYTRFHVSIHVNS